MAKQKKWNNQGGSGWGEKSRKPKKDLPNIPEFEKLPESNTVSFRLSKSKRAIPNYRENGDEVWTNWELFDDSELTELGDYELETPEIRDTIQDFPNTLPYPVDDKLVPIAAYEEYEIVVKYKLNNSKLVLTVSSGQAYAARNQINDPNLDFAIAISSSEPIAIGSYVGLVNLIRLNNASQDPTFSLYNWIRSKLSIATDNDGNSGDSVLDNLPQTDAIDLPPTSFSWQNERFDLFYGSGTSPYQLCLHAIDDVVKFKPNQPVNASFNWTVTAAGVPLPLCKSLVPELPKVFISIAPGSPTQIDPNNNDNNEYFVFRISVDEIQLVDLLVWFSVGGTADPNFFTFQYGADENNIPAFIIPANTQYIDIPVYPLENPNQIDTETIELSIVANPNLYEIGFISQTVELIPEALPIVSVSIAPGSPSEIDPSNIGGQLFVFRISIDRPQTTNFLVKFNFTGTAIRPTDYDYNNLTINNSFVIPANDNYVDINVFPVANNNLTSDLTITLQILQDPTKYTIDINSQTVILSGEKLPIIIKTRYPDTGNIKLSPLLLCTNTARTTISINPFFNNNSQSSLFGAINLISQNGVYAQLQDGAYPTYLDTFDFSISYLQIDIDKLKTICNSFSCRYLLIANANYPPFWNSTPANFGSVSAQKAAKLQLDSFGYAINSPAENSSPYVIGSQSTYGYIDSRWLCQTLSNFANQNQYEFYFVCIQIDLLNPSDITFLTPIYTPPVPSGSTIVNQRPQIVNT